MSLEVQAPRVKGKHRKKKGLQPLAQDNIVVDPRPSKKRRRDETETEIMAIEDKKERKRRKKEEKAKQRALQGDILSISPVRELGPTITDTFREEPKKIIIMKQKDGRNIEESLAEVCLSKRSMKLAMTLVGDCHSGD